MVMHDDLISFVSIDYSYIVYTVAGYIKDAYN
ncbi:hypothetical protein STW0522ENT62_34890 [Enterobacter kobei]|nr:hypothetical protein STW0522ENT62_34890 [Enterobacter kobei]